jgi:hypothetical protein
MRGVYGIVIEIIITCWLVRGRDLNIGLGNGGMVVEGRGGIGSLAVRRCPFVLLGGKALQNTHCFLVINEERGEVRSCPSPNVVGDRVR